MSGTLKLFLFLAFLACSTESHKANASSSSTTRPLVASISNLRTRLKLDEESSSCWDSLTQLQACTGEIITFFLNGEAYLGHSCCQALHAIGELCWPNMVDVLGFTAEEGQILQGYCDKSDPSTTSQSPPTDTVPNDVRVVPNKQRLSP